MSETKMQIIELLDNMKMKRNELGYDYWINALDFFIKLINEDKIVRIKEVYEYIAAKYGTTTANVEKAMRYAKEQCDYYTELDLKKEEKQTNSNFIFLCAKKIFYKNVSQ